MESLLCVDGGHGVVVGGRDAEAPHDDAAAAVGDARGGGRRRGRRTAAGGDLGGEGRHVAGEEEIVA